MAIEKCQSCRKPFGVWEHNLLQLRGDSDRLVTTQKSITKYKHMNTQAIKPGPKPNKPNGTPDERRRVTPPNQPKHPDLKPHIHKPKE